MRRSELREPRIIVGRSLIGHFDSGVLVGLVGGLFGLGRPVSNLSLSRF